jgi:hypothetical protein
MSEIGKVDVIAWALLMSVSIGLCFVSRRRTKGWYISAAMLPFIVLPLVMLLWLWGLILGRIEKWKGAGNPPQISGPTER